MLEVGRLAEASVHWSRFLRTLSAAPASHALGSAYLSRTEGSVKDHRLGLVFAQGGASCCWSGAGANPKGPAAGPALAILPKNGRSAGSRQCHRIPS